MEITKDRVVSIHYELTNPEGAVLDTSKGREPLQYLHGHGNLIPGLESRIEGWTVSRTEDVLVPAAEGYGDHDPQKTIPAERKQFPADAKIEPGVQFQAQGPQGPMVVRVVEVEGDTVTLDANHPLAGVDLNFAIEVVDIREASEEELAHGHVHQKESRCDGDGSCGCGGGH